jgi:hypothetical protein
MGSRKVPTQFVQVRCFFVHLSAFDLHDLHAGETRDLDMDRRSFSRCSGEMVIIAASRTLFRFRESPVIQTTVCRPPSIFEDFFALFFRPLFSVF